WPPVAKWWRAVALTRQSRNLGRAALGGAPRTGGAPRQSRNLGRAALGRAALPVSHETSDGRRSPRHAALA
ncbi:MAG TPA: hypothetical protein VFQ61_35920, partial [Polyangiaceae bacterium]|nr:hypothetical protein [Polyangiaceae bacterium]